MRGERLVWLAPALYAGWYEVRNRDYQEGSTAMKDRPILMSAPMVRATLAGVKTMTRRVITPQPPADGSAKAWTWAIDSDAPRPALGWQDKAIGARAAVCPHGQPGDLLWVRETWAVWGEFRDGPGYCYRADADLNGVTWKPSIFMPRAASRLTLRITDVRVERVQDITPEDCLAEGITPDMETHAGQYWREDARERFATLWDGLNAKRGYGWAANPWVWVISFERAQP